MKSSQQFSELQHILIILNLEREQFERNSASSSRKDCIFYYIDNMSVIQYISNRHFVLMNDWQNQEYFTEFFFMLFSLNFDDHLIKHQKQSVNVLLEKWVKWALNHHSQKYVSDFNIVWQQSHFLAVYNYYLTKTDLLSITSFCTWCMMFYNIIKLFLNTL